MQFVTHVAHLNHLGIVNVEGLDACQLLHQQLTQDIKKLNIGEHNYFAIANIKGRLMFNGLVIRLSEFKYFLMVDQALTELLIKHLTKFKLRSKVNLNILPAKITWQCTNDEILNAVNAFKEAAFLKDLSSKNLDGLDSNAITITKVPKYTLLHHLMSTIEGCLQAYLQNNSNLIAMQINEAQNAIQFNYLMGTLSIIEATEAIEITKANKVIDEDVNTTLQIWHLLHINNHFTWLNTALSEVYTPQMLGLQTSCVSFSKGCYPGQEVIARSEYRGQVKRQLSCYFIANNLNLINLNLPIEINQDVLLVDVDNNLTELTKANESVGQIVQILEIKTKNHLIILLSICQAINTVEVDYLKLSSIA